MCNYEGQRRQAGALTEQDGEGMAEHFPQPAGQEVPGVARPDPLGLIEPGQLPDA